MSGPLRLFRLEPAIQTTCGLSTTSAALSPLVRTTASLSLTHFRRCSRRHQSTEAQAPRVTIRGSENPSGKIEYIPFNIPLERGKKLTRTFCGFTSSFDHFRQAGFPRLIADLLARFLRHFGKPEIKSLKALYLPFWKIDGRLLFYRGTDDMVASCIIDQGTLPGYKFTEEILRPLNDLGKIVGTPGPLADLQLPVWDPHSKEAVSLSSPNARDSNTAIGIDSFEFTHSPLKFWEDQSALLSVFPVRALLGLSQSTWLTIKPDFLTASPIYWPWYLAELEDTDGTHFTACLSAAQTQYPVWGVWTESMKWRFGGGKRRHTPVKLLVQNMTGATKNTDAITIFSHDHQATSPEIRDLLARFRFLPKESFQLDTLAQPLASGKNWESRPEVVGFSDRGTAGYLRKAKKLERKASETNLSDVPDSLRRILTKGNDIEVAAEKQRKELKDTIKNLRRKK